MLTTGTLSAGTTSYISQDRTLTGTLVTSAAPSDPLDLFVDPDNSQSGLV